MIIKIVLTPPPNYKEILTVFPTAKMEIGVLFAYDDCIHTLATVTDDLLVHEGTHLSQQEEVGVKKWWNKYLNDPQFRLEQELEAYHAQYEFLKSYMKDRNKLNSYLVKFARDLSSSLYGSIISYNEALTKIK